MDDNVEDCPVCLTTFDDTFRRPRTLPCGHSLCTPCINGLKDQGAVTCPSCRASHTVPEGGQFPICYAFEGLVRRLRSTGLASVPAKPEKQTAPAPVTLPASKATTGLSKRAQSLLQEQEVKILAAIRSCQEEQSQLADYLTTLGSWGGRQQQLEDELQTLVDQSKNARQVVRHEEFRVEGRQEEVRQREQELHTMLQALRTATTRQEAYEIIEDADHLVEKEESHRTAEGLGVFPDVHTVTTVTRVAEASRAALQAAAAASATAGIAAAAVGDSSLLATSAAVSSITDRVEALLGPPLTAKDLLNLTQSARGLLDAGLVFAVQNVEGQTRHARISLEDGHLHLYSLQAQTPPPNAIILQMGEVVPTAPPCDVFLDLAWQGSAARRVVVNLPIDTPRGRQFIQLCSGQQGACYANTRLFKVECEGQPGECVRGGDYQTNDGRGGAALLPDLDSNKYWGSRQAGAVWWCGGPVFGTQFFITTRNRTRGAVRPGAFGGVIRGLEVVQEAAQHHPITEVTVVQCGVLLSQ